MDAPWSLRILAVLMSAFLLHRILTAGKRQYFIRRIPGIDAIEDAVGRATEMGRPILFSIGTGGLDNMQTLAGLAVLKWVAKQCARMLVKVVVPIFEPVVLPPAAEALQSAYREEGREELWSPEDVRFFSKDQNAYAMGCIGVLTREKAAAAFYFGYFGFESLLMAETGRREGVIQVAGTADFYQIPFFVCACDYTLIGEELYAASAYLSRDPLEVGTLVGQDMGKLLLTILIIAGSLGALLSGSGFNPVEGLLGR
jgi:hypothetical protein